MFQLVFEGDNVNASLNTAKLLIPNFEMSKMELTENILALQFMINTFALQQCVFKVDNVNTSPNTPKLPFPNFKMSKMELITI